MGPALAQSPSRSTQTIYPLGLPALVSFTAGRIGAALQQAKAEVTRGCSGTPRLRFAQQTRGLLSTLVRRALGVSDWLDLVSGR